MTLTDAISAVEQASSAYSAAATTTTNDQATADAIKAKLDTANAQVTTDQASQNTAAGLFNATLDTLIATATANKIPVTETITISSTVTS